MFKCIDFQKKNSQMKTIKNIEFPSTVSVLGKAQTSLALCSLNETVEYSSVLSSASSVAAGCCMSMCMCMPRQRIG